MGHFLAVFAGVAYAASTFTAQMGLRSRGVVTEQIVWMTLAIGTALFIPALLIPGVLPTDLSGTFWSGTLQYAASGLVGSVLSRFLNFWGVELIGPARMNQFLAADTLLTLALSYVFTGDRLPPGAIAGAVLVTSGIFLLGSEQVSKHPQLDEHRPRRQRVLGLVVGLGAALGYAMRNILVRRAALSLGNPVWGALVAAVTAFAAFSLVLAGRGQLRGVWPRHPEGRKWALITAGIMWTGWLALFLALRAIDGTTVSALRGSMPVWGLLFSWLFLRRAERISPLLWLSCGLIVMGGFLVL